jgi:hypothetical protein
VNEFPGVVHEFLAFMEAQSSRVDAQQKVLESLATEIWSYDESDSQLAANRERLSFIEFNILVPPAGSNRNPPFGTDD